MAPIPGYTPIGLAGYTASGSSTISPTGAYTPSLGKKPPPSIAGNADPGFMVPPKKDDHIIRPDMNPGGPGKGLPKGKNWDKGTPKVPRPGWQDADYNAQIAAIQRALNLYKAGMNLQKTQAGGAFGEAGRGMELQRGRDLESMKEDFASRGIVNSGVYGTSVGDYETEWGSQKASLSRQYDDSLANINQSYQEYLNDIAAQREQARLDAIRRRAQEIEANPKKKKKVGAYTHDARPFPGPKKKKIGDYKRDASDWPR